LPELLVDIHDLGDTASVGESVAVQCHLTPSGKCPSVRNINQHSGEEEWWKSILVSLRVGDSSRGSNGNTGATR
jgi:hypothetical protein